MVSSFPLPSSFRRYNISFGLLYPFRLHSLFKIVETARGSSAARQAREQANDFDENFALPEIVRNSVNLASRQPSAIHNSTATSGNLKAQFWTFQFLQLSVGPPCSLSSASQQIRAA